MYLDIMPIGFSSFQEAMAHVHTSSLFLLKLLERGGLVQIFASASFPLGFFKTQRSNLMIRNCASFPGHTASSSSQWDCDTSAGEGQLWTG